MKTHIAVGSLALLFGGAFVSFAQLYHLPFLGIAVPGWLHNLFLGAVAVFLIVGLGMRRRMGNSSLLLAWLFGIGIALVPWMVASSKTMRVRLNRVMTKNEQLELQDTLGVRFILLMNSELLLPSGDKSAVAIEFLVARQLID